MAPSAGRRWLQSSFIVSFTTSPYRYDSVVTSDTRAHISRLTRKRTIKCQGRRLHAKDRSRFARMYSPVAILREYNFNVFPYSLSPLQTIMLKFPAEHACPLSLDNRLRRRMFVNWANERTILDDQILDAFLLNAAYCRS